MRIVIDLDGTICPIRESHQKYSDLLPLENAVEKITELKELRNERSNQVINEKIGQIIDEIDSLKTGYLDDYRKSTKLFEVEHYLKESKKEASQLNQLKTDLAPNGAIARALEEIKSVKRCSTLSFLNISILKDLKRYSLITLVALILSYFVSRVKKSSWIASFVIISF